jgi:hypothetical protein
MHKRKEMKYIGEQNDVAKKPVQPVQPPSLCWLMPSEDLDSFFSCIHRKRVGCCCCCYGRHLSRFFRFDKEINISYTKMSDVLKRISRLGVELLLQQWLAFPASEGKFAYWHQQRKWWGRDSSNAISQWAINQPYVSLFPISFIV